MPSAAPVESAPDAACQEGATPPGPTPAPLPAERDAAPAVGPPLAAQPGLAMPLLALLGCKAASEHAGAVCAVMPGHLPALLAHVAAVMQSAKAAGAAAGPAAAVV